MVRTGRTAPSQIIAPSASPTPCGQPDAVNETIDTSDWTTYKSDLYDLEVGHPPGWSEKPATRKWRLEEGRHGVPEPHARGLPASGG